MIPRFLPLALLVALVVAAPMATAQKIPDPTDIAIQHCALPLTVECIEDWIAGIEDGRWLQLAKWAVCFALGNPCL